MQAAATSRSHYWLIDVRQQGMLELRNAIWFTYSFLPAMHARLNATVCIAYMMGPHQITKLANNPAIPQLLNFDDSPYRVERFTNEQAALDWLLYCYQNDLVAGRT